MHRFSKEQVLSPFDSGQGELVYELLGRSFPGTTPSHSLAYVVIAAGKSSRPHFHPLAEESYYILKGEAQIQIDDETADLLPGEMVFIPPGKVHRIHNPGQSPLGFLAVCVPAWEAGNSVYLDL